MKKIIVIMFAIVMSSIWYANAYQLSQEDQKVLEEFFIRAEQVFQDNPERADVVLSRVEAWLEEYSSNPRINFVFESIKDFIVVWQENYQQQKDDKPSEETKEQEDEKEEVDDEEDKTQDDQSQDQIDEKIEDMKDVLSFGIEARFDNIRLEDVYLENIWEELDLNYLVKDVSILVDWEKVWVGYVKDDNYIHIDVDNYVIPRDEYVMFDIKAEFNRPSIQEHIWELEFKIWQPPSARSGSVWWIRAISESNGNYVSVSVDTSRPQTTLLLKADIMWKPADQFQPSYNIAYKFDLLASNDRLQIHDIIFQVQWSFLQQISEDAEFVLYESDSREVFDSKTKEDIKDNKLVFSYENGSYTISSWASQTFQLEISRKWSVSSTTREIRLDNVVIWDWFWWRIENLSDYSNTWLPMRWQTYRY